MNKVLVIGSVNKDIWVELDHQVAIGETKHANGYQLLIGGKGLNQAIAVAQSGAQTSFLGAINKADHLQISELLMDYGIEANNLIVSDEVETGIAIVTLIDGDNSIVIAPGANSLVTAEVIESLAAYLQTFDYILLQNEVDSSVIAKVVELKASLGYKVIFNPAPYVRHEHLDYSQIDYLTPNQSEYLLMQKDDLQLSEQQLLLTLGSEGVKYQQQVYPAFKVKPVDTTGAGDCFNGYLVGLLAQGYQLDKAIEISQYAASKAVLATGAQAGILPLGQLIGSENEL